MKFKKNRIYFSIIICCYNSEKYLNETIESIINQKYKYWEIILVNDGSNDSTEKIALNFKNRDFPIIYHKNTENLGFAKARNIAVKLANYEWIVINDHDDIMMNDKLEIQSKLIEDNNEYKFFFGDAYFYENDINVNTKFNNFESQFNFKINQLSFTKEELTNELLRYGCFILSSTVVFNKECHKKVLGFNEKLKFNGDYDFFLKLSNKYDFYCSNLILTKWRLHSHQASLKLKRFLYKELSYVLLNYLFYSKNKYWIKLYVITKSLYYFSKFIFLR